MKICRLFRFLLMGGCLVTLLSGCSEKEADYLEKARKAVSLNQFQLAKAYIDSARLQNPKDFDRLREGKKLLRSVEFAEQKRTRDYCDSLLKVCQAEFPTRQKDFTFQQNRDSESSGYYVNIHQLQNRNHNRTFLQARVDEQGRLFLTSYYCGGAGIGHTRVRLYAPDGSFAETLDVPSDGALNHTFSDGEYRYETIRFDGKRQNGIPEFIRLHADDKIRVELIGKRTYRYVLAEQDKKAILGAVELGTVLSDITRLLNEIRLSQAKMNYLVSKMDKDSI